MRSLILLATILILVTGCGGRSRELSGIGTRLQPDQLAWMEGVIEADLAEADLPAGARVAAGRIVARADGEVIAASPLMQAALRGAVAAGGIQVDEGGEAGWLITGEINVQSYAEGQEVMKRYVCELRLVSVADRTVAWRQSYIIRNQGEQARWK
jgi:hypothetical protein